MTKKIIQKNEIGFTEEVLDTALDDIPLANDTWQLRIDEYADNESNFLYPIIDNYRKFPQSIEDAKNIIDENYDTHVNTLDDTAEFVNDELKNLPTDLSSAYNELKTDFSNIGGTWNSKTAPSDVVSTFAYNLSNISAENYSDLDKLNPTLAGALSVNFDTGYNFNPNISTPNIAFTSNITATNVSPWTGSFDSVVSGVDKLATLGSYYNNLDSLIPEYNENYQYAREKDTVHSNFNNLIDGNLPSQWKTNMQKSIQTAMENTIGEIVNDLGARGVLNSSVTTQALYDIERNAADELARQYQQNIQSVGGLVQNRWQVKEQSLNDQKLVLNEVLGYVVQAIGLKLQAKTQEEEFKLRAKLQDANLNFQADSQNANLNFQVESQNEHLKNQSESQRENLKFQAATQKANLALQSAAHEADNIRAVTSEMAQIFTQQFSNSSNAFTQQTGRDTQKLSAFTDTVNTKTQLYEHILNNDINSVNSQFDILSKTYTTKTDAVMKQIQAMGQSSQIYQSWYQIAKVIADAEWAHNLSHLEQLTRMYQLKLQAVNMWDKSWDNVLSNSARKIALSAAAQEALQQPALRLWNAATGLNQSATGVLVALSNQGTRTQTQSSSGNFLGGVLSAGLTAFAGGWGAGVAGAAFGQKQLTN